MKRPDLGRILNTESQQQYIQHAITHQHCNTSIMVDDELSGVELKDEYVTPCVEQTDLPKRLF